MHDLLMTIGLLFFSAAASATVWLLYRAHRMPLVIGGVAALGILAACAILYYGNVGLVILPVAQKLTFFVCTAWLLATYIVLFDLFHAKEC